MAVTYEKLNDQLVEFIEQQHLFFVATAAPDGRVNLSPKGLDTLRVVDQQTIEWLNMTGSGNETAAHLLEQNRMTLMFCSFDDKPLILRVYGTAETIQAKNNGWEDAVEPFGDFPSARQVFKLSIDLVQTSCGFGVPKYDFVGNRDNFDGWVEKKGGKKGMETYWKEKNSKSLDGKPTGI